LRARTGRALGYNAGATALTEFMSTIKTALNARCADFRENQGAIGRLVVVLRGCVVQRIRAAMRASVFAER